MSTTPDTFPLSAKATASRSVMTLILCFTTMAMLNACKNNPGEGGAKKSDSVSNFGDSVPISNALLGRVYLLPDTTKRLPDFDILQSADNPIYVREINVPWQKWSAGFPGLRGRFEWFGIEYTGNFKPLRAGNYTFKLISDDGSKLFIDDKLFIDNDGIHSDWSVKDSIYLSDSVHSIKLDYFQGPRYELALQLFWHLGNEPDKIFPGQDFILYTPKPRSLWWVWLLVALAVLLIAGGIVYRKRKAEKNKKTHAGSADDSTQPNSENQGI